MEVELSFAASFCMYLYEFECVFDAGQEWNKTLFVPFEQMPFIMYSSCHTYNAIIYANGS